MNSLSLDIYNQQTIKSFKISSSKTQPATTTTASDHLGEFYSTTRTPTYGQHHNYSSLTFGTTNFKFHNYQKRKSLIWTSLGKHLKNFMFALLRAWIYILLLLSLSDCWFQGGSAAAILAREKVLAHPSHLEELETHTPLPSLLPIQALIFEVETVDQDLENKRQRHSNRLSEHWGKDNSNSTTITNSQEEDKEQTNDGNKVAFDTTSTNSYGQTSGSVNIKQHHHHTNHQQQQHSISNMFSTATNVATGTQGSATGITASTMASLSGGPLHHRGHQASGISFNTITSTLSAALSSTNDSEWPVGSGSILTSASSSVPPPQTPPSHLLYSFTSTSLPSSSLSLTTTTITSDTSSNLSSSPTATIPEAEFTMPPVHTVLVSIVLLFVILGTIVGNVLVCIAVCMVRKLRRPCNYLLVSLALSDLCVAVLVMPMALLYEVLEKWNFGPVLCDIWVSFDVLCCAASILNLCAISVDRYLAITKPLEYGVKRTPRRMMLCVALVWLAAACISLPPLLILGNEHVDEHGNPMCSVCQNFGYQIYATLGSFYIPLAVMLFVYYQIFRAARRIVLEEKRAQTHLQHALNGTGSPLPGHTDLDTHTQQHRHSSFGNTSLNYSTCGGGGGLSTSHHSSGGTAGHCGGGGSGSSGLLGSPHQKKLRFQLAKEKKASTTLGIIMSAFTICWLPFFILALIRPFVETETTHVPQSLSSLFLWLGYANSLLNPIIYATLNRDFRKPFQEILYFRCSSLNTMMRENYYQDQYGEPPSQRVMLGDERHGARESFL
ncbi:5-hydroxytryptamine receptor 7 [Haematobia irritans]|uniref:5-hydroxytryptamine receptor 7 n=1 Tax=Haematobia irritans TaxID=7368 RepID=UPI003F50CE65